MKILKIFLVLSLLVIPRIAAHEHASNEKGRKEKGHADEHEKGHADEHEKGHADEHERGHTDEHEKGRKEKGHADEHAARNNLGPQKAVLQADEDQGFQLRDGVEERLGVKTRVVRASGSVSVPKSGIVYSKEEYQVLRKRDGFWKAIDVKILRKGEAYVIATSELKAGDSIAIDGTGLLKIVEINVFGPASEGHVH